MNETLVIDLARLDKDGENFVGELDSEKVIDLNDEFIHPFAGLRYELFVQQIGSELVVRGKAEQDFAAVCSRCGGDFDFTVKDTEVCFSEEITEETTFIDLTNTLRECILLNLPNYPICSEDCKGVCPQCGKNLNEGACTCTHNQPNDSWKALEGLKIS